MRNFCSRVFKLTGVILSCLLMGLARWMQGFSFADGVKDRFSEEERKVERELRSLRRRRRRVREASA